MTPLELSQRQAVIAEARTWLGTPYHHAARVKGTGVDCATLLIEVFSAVGLIKQFDPGYYPMDWMMHRDDERYLYWVKQHAQEVQEGLPGDIVVWKFGRSFSHGAIITDWPEIIHSLRGEGCVPARVTDGTLGERAHKIFSLWGRA